MLKWAQGKFYCFTIYYFITIQYHIYILFGTTQSLQLKRRHQMKNHQTLSNYTDTEMNYYKVCVCYCDIKVNRVAHDVLSLTVKLYRKAMVIHTGEF
jgi:hypothetical protein